MGPLLYYLTGSDLKPDIVISLPAVVLVNRSDTGLFLMSSNLVEKMTDLPWIAICPGSA